jgi:hypothetical protein
MIRTRSASALIACLLLGVFASACTKNSTSPTTPSCTFSVAQPTTTFGPEGGTGSAAVTAGSGCSWTATSSATFATITAGSSGSGNGTVTFSIAVNTATADRTATLTIAGSTFTITQRAATTTTPPPTLSAPSAKSPVGGVSVDPGRPTLVVNNATSTGAIGTVTYHFEVSDVNTFPNDPVRTFTVDGIAQGSGTTSWTVNHDLGANVLWYWRARATNGTVTGAFSDVDTFRTGPQCSFVLSTTSINAAAAGTSSTITVTTSTGCTWAATSNSSFITVTSGATGTGSGTVAITIAANNGAARTGTLTIAGQTVAISQSGGGSACTFLLSPASASISGGGGTGSFTVTADSACSWTATTTDSFVTITSGSSGTGNGTVAFSVTANSGSTARTGTITVGGQTFTINQAASVAMTASFSLLDPGTQAGATTECRFRSATGAPTTCTLRSTSFTFGTNTIVSYQWTVQYTYDTVKTLSGTASTLNITDTCGGVQSTADGASNPLSVTLTVTDNTGATATAIAGSGSQPALFVRLFTCGS